MGVIFYFTVPKPRFQCNMAYASFSSRDREFCGSGWLVGLV